MRSSFASPRFFTRLHLTLGLAVASALTACGGGGGGDSAADKYVGTWLSSCSLAGSTSSYRDRAVFTRSSDNVIRSTDYTRDYAASTSCSGSYTESADGYEDLTIVGTKMVDGKTVDKINGVDDTGTSVKLITYVSGNDLFVGINGTRDGEGYPTVLGSTAVLHRQ